MENMGLDRRTFAELMAVGAATVPSLPAWAQGGAARKRNVTMAIRAYVAKRTGTPRANRARPSSGVSGISGYSCGGPTARGGTWSSCRRQRPGYRSAGPPIGRRSGGPQTANSAASETIFKDVSELGFAGLELFDWQINSLESQGVLAGLVEKYKLPLISSYTSINLTDPAHRAAHHRRGRQRRQDPEEVRRQDDRHRTERPRAAVRATTTTTTSRTSSRR